MGRVRNGISPEVAKQLLEVAQQMRREMYGDDGVPKWGTKFAEIEGDCVAVGSELARLMIEQSVEGQVPRVPGEALACSGETAAVVGSGKATTIETPVGEVNWKQPQAHLAKARRDFFPSGPTRLTFPRLIQTGMQWKSKKYLGYRPKTFCEFRPKQGKGFPNCSTRFSLESLLPLEIRTRRYRHSSSTANTTHIAGLFPAFASSTADCEAVAAVPGAPEVMLKWPNDLLVEGAKLAGILLERAGDIVVTGVGINLLRAPDVPGRATTALANHGAQIEAGDFADLLADHFAATLARWRDGEWDALRAEWLARAHPPGTPLAVNDRDGQQIAGTFAGLGADGAALLRLADGTVRPIHAGDVELVRNDAARG